MAGSTVQHLTIDIEVHEVKNLSIISLVKVDSASSLDGEG